MIKGKKYQSYCMKKPQKLSISVQITLRKVTIRIFISKKETESNSKIDRFLLYKQLVFRVIGEKE